MALLAEYRKPRALGSLPRCLAVIGLCCQGLSFSAPVVDGGTDAGPNAGESRSVPSGADPRARSGGKAGMTTGDKNLDLLLELPSGRVAPAASGPGSAKAGVAGGPKEPQPNHEGSNLAKDLRREALALQPARTANAGEARPSAGPGVPPQVQREWVPPPSSGAGTALGAGAAMRGMLGMGENAEADGRPLPSGDGQAGEAWAAHLPAQVRAFLRDNRDLIIGSLLGLLALGAVVKVVWRRR